MRLGPLLRFITGAAEFGRLDIDSLVQPGVDASRLRKYHRWVVIAGAIGGFLGLIFGIIGGVAMFMHPSHAQIRGEDIFLIIFELFVMIAIGILSGASVVCTFLPHVFYQSAIGESWLKMLGTTNVGAARFVSFLVTLIGIGAAIGLIVCIETGHV